MKPTVSGIGFYLHKERGAAEVGILSTQRMSRGRDLDTQRIPRGLGPILISTNVLLEPWFNTKLVSRISAVVNRTSALRALVLQSLLRTTNGD